MARIIATYPWFIVLEKLFASDEQDFNTWLIEPNSDVPQSDELFLATIRYDPYATKAAAWIYSSLDNAGSGTA
ncbi:hypothetical protein QN386_21700 [Pseudomonas sp. CCI3.2]|uniref:hypothetical protein n=1 Tax=unclassified Pseudomonas TaxID=196821 RepID=UPI002AC8F3AB|nr:MULTISPECIES: hypothetical protein [unclassified Pseudomonas]MEB0079726.1 hypothetical protein [Pseudomonas sp. MH10out]MEB0103922.1 hypothetical protein [Pseudomonas sp. CCI3.2]MEB0132167.1 hypothetical protein [Pseudomonas sp. CCI2.4]MEB0157871.1 hypothetical protein [Pseudomonas sp. AH2 (2023)]MEB0169575.1 hypothetical protein [Pseudomonas sp. CCC4.4]